MAIDRASPLLAFAREVRDRPCPRCGAVLAEVWAGPGPMPVAVAVKDPLCLPALVIAVPHRCFPEACRDAR